MKKEINVLVTGSNAPGFTSIVRSIKLIKKYKCKIIATDWKDNLKSRYFSDISYRLPDNQSPEFIKELIKICKINDVDILFPIRTDDQPSICKNLEKFDEIDTIPIINSPNPELMEIALNKRKLLDYIKNVQDYLLLSII